MKAKRLGALVVGLALVVVLAVGAILVAEVLDTGFTYRGRLADSGNAANGSHDFSFTLYDAETFGSAQAVPIECSDVPVTNGEFTVLLDFGRDVSSGDGLWLEIAVRPSNGGAAYTTLLPRQRIGTVPDAQEGLGIGGEPLGTPAPWYRTGNGGTDPNVNFLGTTDDVALEIHVNGARALRIEPNSECPSLIGGQSDNVITSGVYGATIGGGGGGGSTANSVTDHYGTVGGGRLNRAGDDLGTVGDATEATVGGGWHNCASGDTATVSGGYQNSAIGAHATVGGGQYNEAEATMCPTVAGGLNNHATADYSTIGGGSLNYTSAAYATVAGGADNHANGESATTAGGRANDASGYYTAIGGGRGNTASENYATIAGGRANKASGHYTTIAGGYVNQATGLYATVGGGCDNDATSDYATAAGGRANLASAIYASVGGGRGNTANNSYATVAGGRGNKANTHYATVAGGYVNQATGIYATVGGGQSNEATEDCATVAGGDDNLADANYATVSGGRANTAKGYYAAVAGGRGNTGSQNYATVSGGRGNTASGYYATVLGGRENRASGDYSLATGYGAKVDASHDGAMLFSDGTGLNFNSTAANEFAARCTGGARFVSAVNGSGTPTAGVTLAAGGGSWSSISDRNAKRDFKTVDTRELLDRLAKVPITTWRYRTQDASIRHIGPVAQDFHAAFGVGEDDKHITTIDGHGVALGAIQGLHKLLKEKDTQIAAQEKEISDLCARLAKVEATVSALAQTQSGSVR